MMRPRKFSTRSIMDVSSSASVTPQVAAAAAAPAQAAFKNQDRFDSLIDRINNSAGTYSQAEQLDAYSALHTMAVSGELIGMGDANQKLYNAAKSTSSVGEQLKQVSQGYTLAMAAGAQSGGASGARQAALDYYGRQGGSDQAVLFQGHINAADMSGAKPYADPNGWRTSMLAGIKLEQYVESASADGDVAQKAAGDPKLAAALRLADAKTQDAAWASSILELLGQRDPIKDKVDLSDAARRVVGDAPAAPSSGRAYEAGSVADKRI